MQATPAPVRAGVMRRTETPNAVMTTLASPTQGASRQLSLWKVEMRAGQRGPRHTFASEQIWHVASGRVEIAFDAGQVTLRPGDAIVLAAGIERQISAITAAELIVCGQPAAASVPGDQVPRAIPPWVG